MIKRPLILDTEWVRPIDTGSSSRICMTCSEGCARWAIGKPPNGYFSCAKCFLHTSPWGIANTGAIQDLTANVEEAMGESITVDGLLTDNGADRILHSIIFASGVSRMRAQSGGA